MILSNLGQPRFKWCIPQCAISHRGMGGLEHDPEKHALGLDPRVGTGFPSGQTRSVCPEIMLKQKIERDDDSKKSHPALAARNDDANAELWRIACKGSRRSPCWRVCPRWRARRSRSTTANTRTSRPTSAPGSRA